MKYLSADETQRITFVVVQHRGRRTSLPSSNDDDDDGEQRKKMFRVIATDEDDWVRNRIGKDRIFFLFSLSRSSVLREQKHAGRATREFLFPARIISLRLRYSCSKRVGKNGKTRKGMTLLS